MTRRAQPAWLTQVQEQARGMSEFSGIPYDDCFLLINPDSERDIENVVKRRLLDQSKKQWLFDNDLSLDDVFSGRIEGEEKQAYANLWFAEWNAKLGKKVFGF